MDDDVEPGQASGAGPDDAGMSRRTMIRRTAIAGGALLWATPVVQSLGNDSAFANFRGSGQPGGCLCTEQIITVIPTQCHAEPGTAHRIAKTGKYVTLQALTGGSCSDRLRCKPLTEVSFWSQVSAVGCSLYSQTGDTCVVHVTAFPANITLQLTATLTCIDGRGHTKSCNDTKVRKVCFTQVDGSESQRCGRFEEAGHRNKTHGTQRCP